MANLGHEPPRILPKMRSQGSAIPNFACQQPCATITLSVHAPQFHCVSFRRRALGAPVCRGGASSGGSRYSQRRDGSDVFQAGGEPPESSSCACRSKPCATWNFQSANRAIWISTVWIKRCGNPQRCGSPISLMCTKETRSLPKPRIVDTRLSLESDPSFASYDQALAHLTGPKLTNHTADFLGPVDAGRALRVSHSFRRSRASRFIPASTGWPTASSSRFVFCRPAERSAHLNFSAIPASFASIRAGSRPPGSS